MTLLGRASILKNREERFCVYLLEPRTALGSKRLFLSFFQSRALPSLVSCSPTFDYRWKRSADHFSLHRDPVHVFVLPFRQCFIFLFFNKGKKCGNAASQNTERLRTGTALLTCPSSPVHRLTDARNTKRKMKSDSCLSFQTAELTDDLPVWLASMLNSSFQLHSATCIQ